MPTIHDTQIQIRFATTFYIVVSDINKFPYVIFQAAMDILKRS